MMKDEVVAKQQQEQPFKIRQARISVRRRYAAYKENNAGNTEWSKRGGDQGGDFTEGATSESFSTRGNRGSGEEVMKEGTSSTTPIGKPKRGGAAVVSGKVRGGSNYSDG